MTTMSPRATSVLEPTRQVMQEVVKLLAPLNTTQLEGYAEGTDISMWMRAGVPGEATCSQIVVSLHFSSLEFQRLERGTRLILRLLCINLLPVWSASELNILF